MLSGFVGTAPIEAFANDISLAALARPQPALVAGQSATLLPDGRWLVLGGEGQGQVPVATARIVDSCAGQTTTLQHMLHARSWHSATLLPDGNVLILGGLGPDGRIVQDTELFNSRTQNFQVLPDSGMLPRARHTATGLADGQVLVAGGDSDEGKALSQAELWNPRSGKRSHSRRA